MELQDEAGLDVNCLLFCCWTGAAGYGVLDSTEMKAVLDVSRDWNAHIVTGLRAVRIALKERSSEEHDVMDLRRSVKNLELKAEQIQQSLLAGVLNRPPDAAPSVAASRANLDAYVEACAPPLSPPLRTALEHIASASAHG